jgi:transcriptional regulator with XRE-family HTH domain
MIDTEKLQILLRKRKDKFKVLQETFNLMANLLNIDIDNFNDKLNIALTKIINLLELEAQSKRTTGQILTNSDYKAIGIFQKRIKKLKNKRKPALKENRLIRLMPKIYKIKEKKGLSFRELAEYIKEKYHIEVNFTYLNRIYKKINN